MSFVDSIVSGLSGVAGAYIMLWFSNFFEQQKKEEETVKGTISLVLRAGDELLGKIYSLAKNDFRLDDENIEDNELNLQYQFAKFWANIEILRYQTNSFSIADNTAMVKFKVFLDCLESKNVRLVKRSSQRLLGEQMLEREGKEINILLYREFRNKLSDCNTQEQDVLDILQKINDSNETRKSKTELRQRIIIYATVLDMMLDTIDIRKNLTKKRPNLGHKLNKKHKAILKYRIFDFYLKTIPDKNEVKYLGLVENQTADEQNG